MTKNVTPIKNPLSAANTWRLVIDGCLQADKHEYGLLSAWQHVSNTLGSPLNLNFSNKHK
ncbi:hypothetical protein [Legionella cincinnatiensis]|uniref:hypothetical protein n=1 Tax=Legionella cincinnatiensis TaxID=28085 RepID=UPI00104117D9|nr:hypothetical protein [Legionella cincinnatiensis]